jgi:hypothetical protein
MSSIYNDTKIICQGCDLIVNDKINIVYLNEKLITLMNNNEKLHFNEYKNSEEKEYKLCSECYYNIKDLELSICSFCRHNCSVDSKLCSICKNNSFGLLDDFIIQKIFQDLLYININQSDENKMITDIYNTVRNISLVCTKFNNIIAIGDNIMNLINILNEKMKYIKIHPKYNKYDKYIITNSKLTFYNIFKINNILNQLLNERYFTFSFGIRYLLDTYKITLTDCLGRLIVRGNEYCMSPLNIWKFSISELISILLNNFNSDCECLKTGELDEFKVKIKEYYVSEISMYITKIYWICKKCESTDKEYLLNGKLIQKNKLINTLINSCDDSVWELYNEYESKYGYLYSKYC